MHKQFNPHVQCLRALASIGPKMEVFQKEVDRRVWKGTAETFQQIESDDEKNIYTCVVCLDPTLVKDDLWILPCGHIFHQHCILNWTRTHNTCPVCRVPFNNRATDRERLLATDKKRGRGERADGAGAAAPPRNPNLPSPPHARTHTGSSSSTGPMMTLITLMTLRAMKGVSTDITIGTREYT